MWYSMNEIIDDDIAQVLPFLEDKFDVVIADPPYNIGKDFGNNKDSVPLEEYVDWCMGWIQDCFSSLKDDGVIFVYGFTEILAHLSVKYDLDKQKILIWHYTNKTVPSSKFWQRSHESILCLWKGKRPNLQIDQIREPYTTSHKNNVGKTRAATGSRFNDGFEGKETVYKDNGGALPRDVLKVPSLAGNSGERYFRCKTCDTDVLPPKYKKEHKGCDITQHPTQKPSRLTEKLLLSAINKEEKGKVLIPFAGSGSECIVARNLGFDFLGIEINPEYVDFAKRWLEVDNVFVK